MKFFEFLQKHKLFIHYMSVVIIIFGIMALLNMRRETRPNVNFNRVAISSGYPGASPSDIEELIIDPIEEKIAEVDGVEEYRSVSFAGAGNIAVIIDDDAPNPEEIADEVRRVVTEVRGLPLEIDDPVVTEAKASNRPILKLALYGPLKPFDMKLEVERLRDYLKSFEGVQSVSYSGLSDLQLKILTDPQKLDAADITLKEIIDRLGQWAKQRPGGLLENKRITTNLTIGSDYNEIEKLKEFVVRSNDSGKQVRLTDVAEIVYGTEDTQSETLFEDKNAVLVSVIKKPRSDAVTTVDEINAGLGEYSQRLHKDLQLKVYFDDSERVRNRMNIVTMNAVFGLLFVILILVFSLDWRSALVTSVGIPIAILGGIAIVYLLGNTMNSLVIVGMIIVLGMLVDDAIVVCENIYSYIEAGVPPARAAISGVSEIAVPVVATVLTTVVAFSPIIFMKEIIGQFLRVIPITVISMLLVSLFEALVILPVHSEELMKPLKKKKSSFYSKLEPIYGRYLDWSLRYRWLIVLFLVVLTAASAFQGKALFGKFKLFPAVGIEGVNIRIELPKNTPLEKTTETVRELNHKLREVSQGSFESLFGSVGSVTTGGHRGSRQRGTHLASIDIAFVSDGSFEDKETEVLKAIKETVNKFTSEKGIKSSLTIDRPGPPIGKPIQIQVTSRDLEFGNKIINEIKSELTKKEGVNSLETDLEGDSIRYRFLVDNDFAVSEGVNPSDISTTIFAASTGKITNEILKNNEKVEILVGVSKEKKDLDIEQILELKVRNNASQPVKVRSFVKVVEERGPSSIQRLNGLRTITLFGEVDEKIISEKEVNNSIAPFLKELRKKNPNISIETGGGAQDRMNAVADLKGLFILAIAFIFMTISLSFGSLGYPFLVLLTIPMGLIGVVWSLILHGQELVLMGIVGVIGLSGVVVNISIILLSLIQKKIQDGVDPRQAIIESGVRRLRPIIITTITTLTGLFPLIYGIGGVDHFVQPLALAMGWGLFVATILTLIALPALVSFFLSKKEDLKKVHEFS